MTNTRYQVNPVASCGEEADGAVLFNPDINSTTVINLSGLLLWSFMKQPHSIKEIAEFLIESYDGVDIDQATEDALAFVETLCSDFLIEVDDVS
jgi:hypothetical protein